MPLVQRAAQIFGWAFVVVAIAGFIVSRGSMEAEVQHAPHLFGLFPVNLPHNLVHLAFGIWGITAARSWTAARMYGRIGGVAYLGLAVLGFVIPSTFGLMPIGGHIIWLHALLGVGLAYFGFSARSHRVAADADPARANPTVPDRAH